MESVLANDLTTIGQSNHECCKVAVHVIKQLEEALENEINRLDETTARLCGKRDDLSQQLDKCIVALAPHRRLPADVLQYLFLICTEVIVSEDGFSWGLFFPFSSIDIPVQIILSHVCSFWRHIALSTPSLWSSLRVIDPLRHQGPINVLRSRWKMAPVSLSIDQQCESRPESSSNMLSNEGLAPFIDYLQQQIIIPHQIRDLKVRLFIDYACQPAAEKLQEIFHALPSDLKLLDFSLYINWSFDGMDQLVRVINAFNKSTATNLSSLKTLRFGGSTFFYSFIYDRIRPNQLHTLSLRPCTLNWALKILGECPLLETCSLGLDERSNFSSFDPVVQISGLRIPLPLLHRLDLSFTESSFRRWIRSLLKPLDLPNLKSLGFEISTSISNRSQLSESLLEHCLQLDKLQELILDTRTLYSLIEAWTNAHNVRRLRLKNYDLHYFESALPLADRFPLLQYVVIDGRCKDPVTLLQMLEERQKNAEAASAIYAGFSGDSACASILPFKQVQFECDHELGRYKERIDTLRNGGLELVIVERHYSCFPSI